MIFSKICAFLEFGVCYLEFGFYLLVFGLWNYKNNCSMAVSILG